jgi:ceramide glucosyltransferase
MKYLIVPASSLFAILAIAQFVSILAAIWRLNLRRSSYGGTRVVEFAAAVTVLRPVRGLENYIEETLRSTFELDYPHYEIIFCVADADDPVIAVVERLIADYPAVDARLLVGDSAISANPKLNNLAKGWRAARYDWILMADSNVLMPRDQLQRMLSEWSEDTGLVCSPPVGTAAHNLWAELECGFLNTYQARWQSFADGIGLGFAQGKAMLWRRQLLDLAGGIEVLGREIAEDAAATKAVRGLGLRVRMVGRPFVQPLGYRSAAEVFRRQVRWARLRRTTFKLFFVPEICSGIAVPLALAVTVAASLGWSVAAVIVVLAAAWYGLEAWLAYLAGWQMSRWSIPIWLLRDALVPVVWVLAWTSDEFEWRGNAMTVADRNAVLPPQALPAQTVPAYALVPRSNLTANLTE